MIFKKKEKQQSEPNKCIKHIKEQCGHEGYYNFYSLVPYHYNDWIEETIYIQGKPVKRTFCPICVTYWDEPYKKLQVREIK